MSIGSTSGRGFESAASPYVFGAIAVVCLLLWVWFHFDIKRIKREEEAEKATKHKEYTDEGD